ncbi:MAG: hypothetical protein ACTSPE_01370 [Candidatus Thorarchaeota archaeon]
MQTPYYWYVLAVAAVVLVSLMSGMYLVLLWKRQPYRLFSDLPLVFGVTFVAQAINSAVRLLPILGLLPMSLFLFKIRAIIILGSLLPVVAMLLHIWLPSIKRHHGRIVIGVALYWVAVVALAPDEPTVLSLCVPLLLVADVPLIATFVVTWRTHRLKEVRSDLMILSLLIGSIGQVAATNVMVNSLSTMVGTVLAALALINPWHKDSRVSTRVESAGEIATSSLVCWECAHDG